MKPGDLVLDLAVELQGIILETKEWEGSGYPTQYEHKILYEDGDIDWGWESELEVINECR